MLVVPPQRVSIPSATNPKVFLSNCIISINEYPDAKVVDASRRTLIALLLFLI
jgi:hypothetical protein